MEVVSQYGSPFIKPLSSRAPIRGLLIGVPSGALCMSPIGLNVANEADYLAGPGIDYDPSYLPPEGRLNFDYYYIFADKLCVNLLSVERDIKLKRSVRRGGGWLLMRSSAHEWRLKRFD